MHCNYCKVRTKIIGFILLVITSFSQNLFAQDMSKLNIGVGHGYGFPLADLADRFGNSWESTLGIYYHSYNTNIIYGVEVTGFYGPTVREDVFATLKLAEDPFLGVNHTISNVNQRQRGSSGYMTLEKILTFGQNNYTDSGLKLGIGAGYMAHYIRIQDDTNNNAYFQGDYIYGYNRYTFGPAIKQYLGYHLASPSYNYGLSLGIEVQEGFTQSRRLVDFASRSALEGTRIDILTTFKAKFYLNIGTFGNTEFIEY